MRQRFALLLLISLPFTVSSHANADIDDPRKIHSAAKRIHEAFYRPEKADYVDYIEHYFGETITVTITHSIDEGSQRYRLTGNQRHDFFMRPKPFDQHRTRRASNYFDVQGNCYVFSLEGISHNSLYLSKLCFVDIGNQLKLNTIELLDGD